MLPTPTSVPAVHGAADDWAAVATTEGVGAGTIVADDDHDVVVWRPSGGGSPCVMDARCPHQWSHLAAEGVVDGDELVCAAHFWRFDRHGRGTKLNVGGRRDPKSDVEVFECRERDGMIEARVAGRGSGAGPGPVPGSGSDEVTS